MAVTNDYNLHNIVSNSFLIPARQYHDHLPQLNWTRFDFIFTVPPFKQQLHILLFGIRFCFTMDYINTLITVYSK